MSSDKMPWDLNLDISVESQKDYVSKTEAETNNDIDDHKKKYGLGKPYRTIVRGDVRIDKGDVQIG